MIGRRMRPIAVWASDPLGPANTRMMAPLHAPSALSGTGPGSSTPDLTIAPANNKPLTNEGLGIAARDLNCIVIRRRAFRWCPLGKGAQAR
jgi:hypothetical protein